MGCILACGQSAKFFPIVGLGPSGKKTGKEDIAASTARILNELPVEDLSVEEIEIEEVIKKIFTG